MNDMDEVTKAEFIRILSKCMSAYSKPLPLSDQVSVWIEFLSEYPIHIIKHAFASYTAENDVHEPKPAAIVNRCKLLDGRPNVEEAWAMALPCKDEGETVVWTEEMAQAFAICRPVLVGEDDEIGGRMTFKEAYIRLVSQARLRKIPARWFASAGYDPLRREAALTAAINRGLIASAPELLLSAPVSNDRLALSSPENYDDDKRDKRRENMRRVKELLSTLEPAYEKASRFAAERAKAERDYLQSLKDRALAKQIGSAQ